MHAHAVIYLFNRSQALQRALSVGRLPAAHWLQLAARVNRLLAARY
jgi:hypothetical protein